MAKLILSPCGISFLTNFARDSEAENLICRYANAGHQSYIPDYARAILSGTIKELEPAVEKAEYREASAMSAELNSIIKFYGAV